uniref:Sushi domain-containing protein n=1 Tax=Anopheles atroparvus TaxID=41427 RepID=A0A182J2V4_ANOAO
MPVGNRPRVQMIVVRGLATANNHQLSASSSVSSPPDREPGEASNIRLREAATQAKDTQRVAEQLIDNKIHDKLLQDRIAPEHVASEVRQKREDIFSDNVLTNNYAARDERWHGLDLQQPQITEEVLLVSNLTEERLREENELLEHLNRDRFHGSSIKLDSSSSTGSEAQEARKSPKRGGKKGRRRKGHKKHKHKKLKLLPVTLVGVPVNEYGEPDASIIEDLTNGAEGPWLNLPADSTDVARPDAASGGEGNPPEIRRTTQQHVVEIVDVWKETTLPPAPSTTSRFKQASAILGGQRSAYTGFPPPPVLVGDGHLGFGTDAAGSPPGMQMLPTVNPNPGNAPDERRQKQQRKWERDQRKRENQQRKQLKKANGQRKVPSPPLPPPPPGVTASSASTVTFPADDHNGTETVSVSRVIISGDLSCMRDDFIPAPAIANADIKYLRNDLYGLEHSFLEAEYHCRMGYRLRTKDAQDQPVLTSTGAIANANLICRRTRWIGKRPACVRIRTSPALPKGADAGAVACGKDHRCPQACHRVPVTRDGSQANGSNRTTVCSCYKGFKMVNHRCVDINECTEYGEDVCEYGCSNTIGSFTCKCPRGLRVTDNNKCMDVNECLLRNGHGPCQDTCINTWSSYRCTCDGLPGTRLAPDGHSCEDIDECTVGNGGCSHTCLNTLGRAFCVCPEGYMLDEDWKTCVDVDECANQHSMPREHRCPGRCVNTVGSYRCEVGEEDTAGSEVDGVQLREGTAGGEDEQYQQPDYDTLCPTGYHFNTTMGDCQDTNECSESNGGCQQHCTNSDGSHYCSCKYGFKLDLDKRSCLVLNESLKLADVACPPLFPPRHGYLECSRPIDEIADGPSGGSLKITNRPGSQCILKCPTGYRPEGKFSKICGTTGEWIGDENGTCIRYPQPKLSCPTSVNVELHQNETESTTVRMRRPETDVSWERDVQAEPSWVKKDSFPLPLGSLNVTLSARHPVSKLHTDCTFLINVLPGSPPRVDFCPDTQVYTIEGRHQSVKATWEEPVFSDNVGVVTITKSNSPGTDFGAGNHLITYEAHDEAEWKSKCVFKIVVNVNPQQQQQQQQLQQQQQQNGGQSHFQLPILYNRFYF